ncbi:spindle pole body component 110 isoform X1 [Nilaparvata lugens]|uniref:spindle pole body component 110 isoform X1 n=1 Tax=Nilaparvata lugens TaxID=108931 RepID=UPI00193D9C04|nr:spindle pole body component 110 isoform X1 [Nilaparvata lugens]XP_039277058.1 spindle pole body component 110 isoform X1 [Nilaparvata lugens]XP_039277059.1 spindle pole body component 110 isoform X1 [Nilaparvata lugens]
MKRKSKSKNILTNKRLQNIEKTKTYSEAENFNDIQEVVTLEKRKEKLKSDQADLSDELQNIVAEIQTETQQKIGIEQELEELRKEVKLSERSKESLEQEAFDLAEKTQDALISLDKRLEIAEKRQRMLENVIIQIKQYQENRTAEARKQFDSVWSTKCREVEESEQREEEDIKNLMNKECEDFAQKLKATNDDIIRREKEIAKLGKKLHEQGLQLAAQVTNIQKDIEKERREYELQMNAKMAFYKAEANKLAHMNDKIVHQYESKLRSDTKAASMEKFKTESLLKVNYKDEQFQTSVNSLEEKLMKDVKNTMKWANHYSELENRKKAALSELDEEPTETPKIICDGSS